MAVAYQTGVATKSTGNVATLTSASMTVSGSNTYLLALVVSGAGSPVDPVSCKWGGSGGTAMTKIGTTLTCGPYWKATLYELVAPAAGANTLYVDYGTNQDETGVIGVLYTGVDQTTPRGTVGTGYNNNSRPQSATCTTVAGDTVVGAIFIGTDFSGFSDSQTVRQSWAEIAAGYELASVGDKTASGTSTTVNWSTTYTAPWGAFAIPLKAAAAGTTITPGAGAVALAGSAPTVAATDSKTITPSAGAVVLAGAAPSVSSSASLSITPSAGAVTIAGATPVLTLTLPAPGAGAIVLTGYAPTVTNGQSYTITPTAGAVVVSGSAPTLTQTANQWVTPAAGAVVLSGSAPAVLNGQSYLVTPAAGSVSLAGAAPSVSATAHQTVTPGAASVVLSGSSPVLAFSDNRVVTPDAGAVVLAGAAPSLSQAGSWNLTPGAGAIQITGYAPVVIGKRPQGAGKSSSKRRRVVIGERVYEVSERDIPALLEAELLDRAPPKTAEVVAGPAPKKRVKKQPVRSVEEVRTTLAKVERAVQAQPDADWL
ncbi:MAG: hypothetical protein IT450_12530, partial [Phycisphaerales bacterium]|nr:hypothetical protein [Phycisphaerales bacterium]